MKGYVAITTAIILSLLVLVVALTLANSTFIARYNNVDFNSKKTSYFLARTCLNKALLKLSQNPNYSGNETVIIGGGYQCSIVSVETSGSNKIIKSRAQLGNAATNLRLTVNGSTLSTVSLEEVVTF